MATFLGHPFLSIPVRPNVHQRVHCSSVGAQLLVLARLFPKVYLRCNSLYLDALSRRFHGRS